MSIRRIALAGVVTITCACTSGPGGPGMRAHKVPKAKRVDVAFAVDQNNNCVINDPRTQTLKATNNDKETRLYWEISNECDVDVTVDLKNFVLKGTTTPADPFVDDQDDGMEGRKAVVKPGKVRQIHVDTLSRPPATGRKEYKYDIAYMIGTTAKTLDPDVIIEWP